MNVKEKQLKQNYSTASGKLLRDLLFHYITKEGVCCYRCGKLLTRNTFSIDHKIPWLHSKRPTVLYFNVRNIAYSHKSCNYSAARRITKYKTEAERIRARNKSNRKSWTKHKRRRYYLRTSK